MDQSCRDSAEENLVHVIVKFQNDFVMILLRFYYLFLLGFNKESELSRTDMVFCDLFDFFCSTNGVDCYRSQIQSSFDFKPTFPRWIDPLFLTSVAVNKEALNSFAAHFFLGSTSRLALPTTYHIFPLLVVDSLFYLPTYLCGFIFLWLLLPQPETGS